MSRKKEEYQNGLDKYVLELLYGYQNLVYWTINEFPWHENVYEILTTNLQLTIKQKALQTKTYNYKLLGIYNLT